MIAAILRPDQRHRHLLHKLSGFRAIQSAALEAIAASLDKTPKQVALAWLLQRSKNILLIPGTSGRKPPLIKIIFGHAILHHLILDLYYMDCRRTAALYQ
jgi:hypothetical protein